MSAADAGDVQAVPKTGPAEPAGPAAPVVLGNVRQQNFILRSGLIECLILIALAFFVVMSVSEVTSRQAAIRTLETLEQQLSADFSEANAVGSPAPAQSATSSGQPIVPQHDAPSPPADQEGPREIFGNAAMLGRKIYIHHRNLIRYARSALDILDHNGGDLSVQQLLTGVSIELRTNDEADRFLVRYGERANSFIFSFLTQSSDSLLAIVATCSGGIGSLIAGLRRKETTAFRDVLLGLASGFVVYVVILGGKYVFLIQQGEAPLNP